MLRIRLRRVGKKGHASYRVVVADQRAPRDGAFIESLGAYDPHATPPASNLNADRAREWLSKGAQPSEAAEKILKRAGIIDGGVVAEAAPTAEASAETEAEAPAEEAAEAEAEAPTEAAAEPALASESAES